MFSASFQKILYTRGSCALNSSLAIGGSVLVLGGVFTLLAASQILPPGVNAMSHIGGHLGGAILIACGLLSWTVAAAKFCLQPRSLAEIPPETNVSSAIPAEVLELAFDYLSFTDLLNVRVTCSDWHRISHRPVAISLLGQEVARRLLQLCGDWSQLATDLLSVSPDPRKAALNLSSLRIETYKSVSDENKPQFLYSLFQDLHLAKARTQGYDFPAARSLLAKLLQWGCTEGSNLLMALGTTLDFELDEADGILQAALTQKSLPLLKLLHENGIFDLTLFRDKYQGTLLHYFAGEGENNIIEYLIHIGVPTNVNNLRGDDYLTYGEKKFNLSICRAIVNYLWHGQAHDPYSKLKRDSLEDCLAVVTNINVPVDNMGNTVHHYAVMLKFSDRQGGKQVIELLAKKGGERSYLNKIHQSPKSLELYYGAKKVFEGQPIYENVKPFFDFMDKVAAGEIPEALSPFLTNPYAAGL